MTRAPTLARGLADIVVAIDARTLPAATVHAVRRHLLDTLGAALAGAAQPEPLAVAAAARAVYGSGHACPLWGRAEAMAPGPAALVNGCAAHALELDDASGCDHSGAVVVPAVFAALGMPGAAVDEHDFVAAIVAGYEVGRRVLEAGGGYDGHNNAGWHSTGTCGVFAAAAAVARALRCDAAQTAAAFGAAASFASGTWAFLADGAMTKRVHPGHAASAGLLAVELARAGLVTPSQVFEAPWGGFFATYCRDAAQPDLLLAEPGLEWRIHRSSIKPFASCRGTHAAIEAMLELRRGLSPGDVAAIEVHVTPTVARMCGSKAVASFVDAQMSLPYALAVALLHGSADAAQFGDGARRDPGVQALMQRVQVQEDASLPSNVAARLALKTSSGERRERRIDVPLGSAANPLPDSALVAKYRALADPVLGAARVRALRDRVWTLGSASGDAHTLAALTRAG